MPFILILYSVEDDAGRNIIQDIKRRLNLTHENYGYLRGLKGKINGNDFMIYQIQESIIDFKIPKINEKIDLIICASKHASRSGIPVLSTHTPGNFSSAEFGGESEKLAFSYPLGLKKALIKLKEVSEEFKLDYQVCYEVTHHGPTHPYPIQFIEVGSSKKEWNDPQAISAASKAVIFTIKNFSKNGEFGIGVGGGHYAPSFTKIGLETDIKIGHIIPKYHVRNLSEKMFKMTVRSNVGECKWVILDWKGIQSKYRKKIVEWASKLDIEVVKTSEII
ncbi:MAG: D-aminoacyl-tRNA deacylase [Candidatus Odinarchaeia archaeon]